MNSARVTGLSDSGSLVVAGHDVQRSQDSGPCQRGTPEVYGEEQGEGGAPPAERRMRFIRHDLFVVVEVNGSFSAFLKESFAKNFDAPRPGWKQEKYFSILSALTGGDRETDCTPSFF